MIEQYINETMNSSAKLHDDVLTTERLDQIFNSMDVVEQNQIRMVADLENRSVHSVIERCLIKGKADYEGAFSSIPHFSLMQ